MREIYFVNSYQRTTNYVKNNDNTVIAIAKRRIKTSRKALGSRVRFSYSYGRDGNGIFWQSEQLTFLISILQQTREIIIIIIIIIIIMAYVLLQLNLPPKYEPKPFQLVHPSPSYRTYFIDDPTIHRTLREHGVRRKNWVTDINMVLDFFPNELLTSG